jgi:hypothetical protein
MNHNIEREQGIRDYKGQEGLVVAVLLPSLPAFIAPFPASLSMLCAMST